MKRLPKDSCGEILDDMMDQAIMHSLLASMNGAEDDTEDDANKREIKRLQDIYATR